MITLDEETNLLDNPIEDITRWIAYERKKHVSDVVAICWIVSQRGDGG